jgi:hypothetical protein
MPGSISESKTALQMQQSPPPPNSFLSNGIRFELLSAGSALEKKFNRIIIPGPVDFNQEHHLGGSGISILFSIVKLTRGTPDCIIRVKEIPLRSRDIYLNIVPGLFGSWAVRFFDVRTFPQVERILDGLSKTFR